MMKKESALIGLGGFVLGGLIVAVAATALPQTKTADSGMTMNEMSDMLKGKTGDEFDKAFIAGMIEHHQGAIDMANLAKDNSKHTEIKQMADKIISA